MATTTNLSLPIIVTGTEAGTWGDLIDNGLTSYLDIAIAGGLAISITGSDVTLTNTVGTNAAYPSTGIGSTTAQYAILNISGVKTVARNLNLPITSKSYIINNAGTGGYPLTVRGVTPTTGITLVDGETAVVAWNGTDYVKIANQNGIANFTGLGVGATPSTWSTGKAVEVGGSGAAVYGSSSVDMQITSNAYYNTAWKYATSAPAAKYQALSGTHAWSVAPTGIVGATTTIYSGQIYTVTTLGSTTLAQWQAFFSDLTGVPVVTQVITATASGTLLGGATVTQSLTFVRAMGITNNGGVTFGSSATAYGTSGQVLTSQGDAAPIWSAGQAQIQPISASVASNELTISASALNLNFRNTSLSSGTVTSVAGTPANLVVPSGTTLGSIDSASILPAGPTSRLIVLALNNAGTLELAVSNLAGGQNLTETNVINTDPIAQTCTFTGSIVGASGILTLVSPLTGTFAIGQVLTGASVTQGTYVQSLVTGTLGAAGSTYQTNQFTTAVSTTMTGGAGMGIYSTAARTGVAYRVIGYIESTQATAGTWVTAPSTIQGAGGQALTAMSSFGYGQTWQILTSSRASNTTYYNTTGKAILISVIAPLDTTGSLSLVLNGFQIVYIQGQYVFSGISSTLQGLIPPGSSYFVIATNTTIGRWAEFR